MNPSDGAIRVLCLYGNPKHGGFVHGCIEHVAMHLERKGVEIDRVRLGECAIADCAGYFKCLRSGQCSIRDDMIDVIELVRRCDEESANGSTILL
jgi:multimeric flavodoxin WrbA